MSGDGSVLVRIIASCSIKPLQLDSDSNSTPNRLHRYDLTPWDFGALSVHYIQKGLLFQNPSSQSFTLPLFIHRLKTSLSKALSLFSPLAGRLAVDDHHSSSSATLSISIDCCGAGAEFIHAEAPAVTVADILAPGNVPPVVNCFFALSGAVNFDGISLPLLVVQVTELANGFFVGCSFNHTVGDGTSFWHFFNAWAEICRSTGGGAQPFQISRPPQCQRWFPENIQVPIYLPFKSPEQFIERFSPPTLGVRFFHFTAQSVGRLKAMANASSVSDNASISYFQALSAHVWIAVTRARGLSTGQRTRCFFAVNTRPRMDPPLSGDYFGNTIDSVQAEVAAGDLLSNGLGWAAMQIHHCVVSFTSVVAHASYEKRVKEPVIYKLSSPDTRYDVRVGSSPRFDMYGVDFGVGRAMAVRSGVANKFDGKLSAYPGREGGGSVDLEICVPSEVLLALEKDPEFMSVVFSPC